jgi:uncharacterized integral membrane protein
MNATQKQTGWNFWIWWVVLTIIGGVVGSYVADRLSLGMLNWPTDMGILLSMVGSGVFALAVSTAQWFLLRRLFSKSGWWIVAGTFGRAFGVLIGSMLLVTISSQIGLQAGFWSTSFYLAIRGAIVGVSQWLVLKQWRVKAGWWILGEAVAWMLGSILLDLLIPPTANTPVIISDLIQGAIAGAITGAVMIWILRQPSPEPTKETGRNRLVIAWILVWAASWGISWAVGWSFVRNIIGTGYILASGEIGGRVAGVIAGLIGGIGTAIILRLAKPSNSLKIYHLILIAVGWAGIVFYDWLDGFVVAGLTGSQNTNEVAIPVLAGRQINHGMGGLLSGLVGGILTALLLLWIARSLNWKQLSLVILGWTAGFAIAGWVAWTIGFPIALNYVYGPLYGNDPGVSSLILFTLISTLCGAFAGWIGGTTTLEQLPTKPA